MRVKYVLREIGVLVITYYLYNTLYCFLLKLIFNTWPSLQTNFSDYLSIIGFYGIYLVVSFLCNKDAINKKNPQSKWYFQLKSPEKQNLFLKAFNSLRYFGCWSIVFYAILSLPFMLTYIGWWNPFANIIGIVILFLNSYQSFFYIHIPNFFIAYITSVLSYAIILYLLTFIVFRKWDATWSKIE